MKERMRLAGVAALALPLVLLAGCADDGTVNDSIATLKTGGASLAYGLNVASTSSLLQFSLATGGAVSPVGTLTLPGTFTASAVAVDPSNGTIYIGGVDSTGGPEVLVYAAGSAGAATPLRTITVAASDFAQPLTMTVDQSGKLYVVSAVPGTPNAVPTIAVFAAGSTGAATPVKTIAGGSTGLFLPTAVTVDAAGDIYVANADPVTTPYSGVITEFSPSATGNAAPTRSITNLPQIFNGVAVDAQQNLYAVEETLTVTNGVSTYANPQIVVFAPGASGPATPVKTIGESNTGMSVVGEIQVDAVGNLYVANETANGAAVTGSLLGFAPAASGNQAPALKITSTALTAGSAQFAIK